MENKEIWQVYIIKCKDKTLYTGITKDIAWRLRLHNCGKASKYTRGRGPFKLMAISTFIAKSEALKIEEIIKSFPKEKKILQLLKISLRMEKEKIENLPKIGWDGNFASYKGS
uniref:Putative endonuclease n=1 Tax=viral metagenome TaxID=1070528 RepID=A0A6M3L2T7_9ZZZZ